MSLPTVLVLGHRFASLDIEHRVLQDVAMVVDGNALSSAELETALGSAQAILLGTRSRLDAPQIAELEQCRVIVRYGIGVDNIALEQATERGILVANVPDYCLDEVSDHAISLLLAASRRLLRAATALRAGTWNMNLLNGVQRLSEQTVGVVGYGRIGQMVAYKIHPFVHRIVAFDPVVSPDAMRRENVISVSLEQLLGEADFISLHCPLNAHTRHLMNAKTLALAKPTAWLINTSRGELVDEAALYDALVAGRLGGAALDVFAQEPPSPDLPLLQLENVIATPHIAYYSASALQDLQQSAALEARAVLTGQKPKWLVNPQALEAASTKRNAHSIPSPLPHASSLHSKDMA